MSFLPPFASSLWHRNTRLSCFLTELTNFWNEFHQVACFPKVRAPVKYGWLKNRWSSLLRKCWWSWGTSAAMIYKSVLYGRPLWCSSHTDSQLSPGVRLSQNGSCFAAVDASFYLGSPCYGQLYAFLWKRSVWLEVTQCWFPARRWDSHFRLWVSFNFDRLAGLSHILKSKTKK